jgi:hypothetical protein
MNFEISDCLRATVFAGGNEHGGGKRDFHGGDIHDLLEAQPLRKKIVGRARDYRVHGSSLKGWDCLANIAELNILKVFEGIDVKTRKSDLGKHIRIRTDAVDA